MRPLPPLRFPQQAIRIALLVTPLLCILNACGGGGSSPSTSPTPTAPTPEPTQQIHVSVSPATASVTIGRTQQFTASVTNTSNTSVNWQVNGVLGGNSTVGIISATGLYTAPASVPSPAAVTVSALSQADPTKSGKATVTITVPKPVADASGNWDFVLTLPSGNQARLMGNLVQAGTAISAVLHLDGACGIDFQNDLNFSGNVFGSRVELTAPVPTTINLSLTLSADGKLASGKYSLSGCSDGGITGTHIESLNGSYKGALATDLSYPIEGTLIQTNPNQHGFYDLAGSLAILGDGYCFPFGTRFDGGQIIGRQVGLYLGVFDGSGGIAGHVNVYATTTPSGRFISGDALIDSGPCAGWGGFAFSIEKQ